MKQMKFIALGLSVTTALLFNACSKHTVNRHMKQENNMLQAYSQIAKHTYLDTLADAKNLQIKIDIFAQNPTENNLLSAKNAWLLSRESYGQTEIFRLANGPIDAEDGWVADAYGSLEGQLNAWPLDENMIDYTIDANGVKTSGNIIDTKTNFNTGGEGAKSVNVTNITVEAITALNENGGDANVATGYHAIEFLLWGQDQDYKNFVLNKFNNGDLQAGQRPLTDFTSDKNAQRRLTYLKVASEKIVQDLTLINSAWSDKAIYSKALNSELSKENADKNISKNTALTQIFGGMGVFIKSELANERIAVAILTPSEEDEHSCFSDNTHRDISANYQGFKNILLSTYNGMDFGKAPIDALDKESKTRVLSLMKSIESKINSIDIIAQTSRHFDRQIRPNDSQSIVIVKLKNELRKLGDEMVVVAKANGIDLTISDVTNLEETKF